MPDLCMYLPIHFTDLVIALKTYLCMYIPYNVHVGYNTYVRSIVVELNVEVVYLSSPPATPTYYTHEGSPFVSVIT